MEKSKDKTTQIKKEAFGRSGASLKMGIIGLQQSGKTSTFELLSKLQSKDEKPAGEGKLKAEVTDPRLDKLSTFYDKTKTLPILNIIDLSSGIYSPDEGLGAELLSKIPAVDGIFQIIKTFEEENEEIDPIKDLETVKADFIGKDKSLIEKKLFELEKGMKRGDSKFQKDAKEEKEVLEKVLKIYANNGYIKENEWTNQEMEILNSHLFLTTKPVVYLINLSEKDFLSKKNKWLAKINQWVIKNGGGKLVPFSVAYEMSLFDDSVEPKAEIIKETGVDSSLRKIINAGYQSLDLIHFFTVGEQFIKVWTIRTGYKAPQAAGILHSDFEKKYISAEIVNYVDLIAAGSEEEARQKGTMRVEGKTCEVLDGDIVYFKFNASDPVKKKK